MWKTDLVIILRVIINDVFSPQKYTDSYLQTVLVAAGILAENDIKFSVDYNFDISNIEITPDPFVIQDGAAQAILSLKAACLLTQAEFKAALGQGIRIRDGDSVIDTSVSFRGYRDILEKGPCDSYEKLKKQINSSNIDAFGAVISPYRGPDQIGFREVSLFFDQFNLMNRRNV
jgi:hypothetical protein